MSVVKFEALERTDFRPTLGGTGVKGDFKLKLPALLEARRKQYAIPDACFRQAALFDRVLLWQIPIDESDKLFPGSSLFAPSTTREKLKDTAPRGVLVSAGLAALDYLWANGVEVGNIIKFVRLSPWHMPVGMIEGHEIHLQVLRVGDIVAVEDITEAEFRVVRDEERAVHQLELDGKLRPRAEPDPSNEY